LTGIFKKIRSTKQPAPKKKDLDVPTVPVTLDITEKIIVREEKAHLEVPQLVVGCSQSVGRLREHNEDTLFALTTFLGSNGNYTPLGLFIVADGMGGHKHGEIASGLAVRTIVAQIIKKVVIPVTGPKTGPPSESLQEILLASVQDAHRAIVKDAPGSGTTMTAVLILEKQMTVAHVGDSRLYHVDQDGNLQSLTRDHSLVMRMRELGQLTADEAAIHPQRNVLYRALGQGEPFTPDINTSSLPSAGHLLLCSDGLWGVVPEEEIVRLVTTSPDPQSACQLMVDAANAAGGPDNISAILVRVPD
jgi:serine/threonine protein phosphatase PrpC